METSMITTGDTRVVKVECSLVGITSPEFQSLILDIAREIGRKTRNTAKRFSAAVVRFARKLEEMNRRAIAAHDHIMRERDQFYQRNWHCIRGGL